MADSKENDKFDLVVRVKRRRSKSAKLETIISFCHRKKQNKTKNSWRLFHRAYGKGEDIVKIYPSLSVIRR